MPDIKSIVMRNMRKITLIMVAIILFLSTAIQTFSLLRTNRQNALHIFGQIGQILEENSRELEQVREEYRVKCLNDARTAAHILEYDPAALHDVEALKGIAAELEVDEIHIFDRDGVIIAGTHPEYFGYSFDSGEQIRFFRPLLADKSLELVQEVMPNTAEGRQVQYSALWSEDGEFIVQIGMAPSAVLRMTRKNELSYIFSLLRTGVGYSLYAIDPDTGAVVGSTVASAVGRSITELGFRMEQLESDTLFRAGTSPACWCLSERIGGNIILWASPASELYRSLLTGELVLLAGLILIALILSYAVSVTMDRTVAGQIRDINRELRAIQDGDLRTKVHVEESREFQELSTHINSMVDSLLQSSEKLEMGEQIRRQKEELERQHEQLETAVERAEAANRAKSEFLFNMSHDLRTPMNAILGFTDLALESSDPETQREYLENIDISSRQLLSIINNILELSKIENYRVVIEEELVDVEENCRRLSTIFDGELKKKHQTCTLELDIRHRQMYLDTTHYSQILLNVVGNAIQYTPDGGAVTISVRELPGTEPGLCRVETVVSDNGIGMSDEFLAHVYEAFARERSSTDSGIQGTGLGLAIVKNLVGLMRGTIDIKSRPGEGTTVTICLPHRLAEAPGEKEEDPGAMDAVFQGRRILLAEDIDINAIIAVKLLTTRGCKVERARDGVECIDMMHRAEAGYYDLVLMDIQMPNMDGYQAARSIRALGDAEKASIPILALTANAFQEDCDRATEAGMDGHIAKPLDAAKMFRTIAEALQAGRHAVT